MEHFTTISCLNGSVCCDRETGYLHAHRYLLNSVHMHRTNSPLHTTAQAIVTKEGCVSTVLVFLQIGVVLGDPGCESGAIGDWL